MPVSEMTDLRLPPQNLEAEQSVLGAILLDNAALNRAIEIVSEEDFYRSAHQKLYRAMMTLSEQNEPVDQITLTEHLKGIGELDTVGGASYIAELVHIVASAANIRYHCKIVHDKSMLRGLIRTATDVARQHHDFGRCRGCGYRAACGEQALGE